MKRTKSVWRTNFQTHLLIFGNTTIDSPANNSLKPHLQVPQAVFWICLSILCACFQLCIHLLYCICSSLYRPKMDYLCACDFIWSENSWQLVACLHDGPFQAQRLLIETCKEVKVNWIQPLKKLQKKNWTAAGNRNINWIITSNLKPVRKTQVCTCHVSLLD